jgi:hypothetical protein
MSKRKRALSEKLKNTNSKQYQLELSKDWSANWKEDQLGLVRMLETAIKTKSHDGLCIATGQLKTVTKKRFGALENAFDTLASSDNSIEHDMKVSITHIKTFTYALGKMNWNDLIVNSGKSELTDNEAVKFVESIQALRSQLVKLTTG